MLRIIVNFFQVFYNALFQNFILFYFIIFIHLFICSFIYLFWNEGENSSLTWTFD